MEAFLNAPIKDVISELPQIGSILEEYDVGCVTCQVGTCLLKDIVAIHDLSPESERALMIRISEMVSPGAAPVASDATPVAELGVTPPSLTSRLEKNEFKYSPPMRQLVDEHVLINRWVALIPQILRLVDVNAAEDRRLLSDGVDFIRSYADRFHHAKEEDILFSYFDESLEIIQAMLADHETARAHVRQLVESVEGRDGDGVAEHLGAYGELLSGHIRREDEILYPWMDRELTTTQVGELFSRFAAVDQAAGPGFTDKYTSLVSRVEAFSKQAK
jgi:hemerythrin-like domain-containing protein